MASSTNNISMEESTAKHGERLDAARKLISSLILVRKNYSLYPEGHTICKNGLEAFSRQLENHLSSYGELRLKIEKDRLISLEEVIHSEPPEEGALSFTLFRDGLRWLAFIKGIDLAELTEFLRIINRYTVLSEESEGDIVTDLWEKQLPHIKYEVADIWDDEQEEEIRTASHPAGNSSMQLREKMLADTMTISDPAIDPAAIEITPEDFARISEMVSYEEEGDPTSYLDALLDSLLQYHDRENFEIIIEILEEELRNALQRKDFDVTLKILKNLRLILGACPSDTIWAGPMIEDFYIAVSSPQSLSLLVDVWHTIDARDAEKAVSTLRFLQPAAIPVLALLLTKNQPVKLRDMLVEVIVSLASKDVSPLESLLKSQDEKLMERLVHVFVRLKGEIASKYLLKLIHHPSTYVRHEALKGLMGLGPSCYKDIFSLIEDKDEAIRQMILKLMGKSRDQVAESLLLEYLEKRNFTGSQYAHVIACFTALGQCASLRSIPFLRQTLLGSSWLPSFSKSASREGAAVALSRMGTDQSRKVLNDAARSLNPVLRKIVRRYTN